MLSEEKARAWCEKKGTTIYKAVADGLLQRSYRLNAQEELVERYLIVADEEKAISEAGIKPGNTYRAQKRAGSIANGALVDVMEIWHGLICVDIGPYALNMGEFKKVFGKDARPERCLT